jgi:hypothetical protein
MLELNRWTVIHDWRDERHEGYLVGWRDAGDYRIYTLRLANGYEKLVVA